MTNKKFFVVERDPKNIDSDGVVIPRGCICMAYSNRAASKKILDDPSHLYCNQEIEVKTIEISELTTDLYLDLPVCKKLDQKDIKKIEQSFKHDTLIMSIYYTANPGSRKMDYLASGGVVT